MRRGRERRSVVGTRPTRLGTEEGITALAPLVLLALTALFVAHVIHLQCVAEDAYITFRFARNWADGFGLVWNVGEAPVEGYTNFLWVAMVAGALRLGWDAALFAQIAGTFFGLATLLLVYRMGRRLLAWSVGAALFPTALLAASGPFAAWAGSGMETVLFTYLVMQAAYWHATYGRTEARRPLILSHLTLALATLTRPEGLLVWGAFCLAAWITSTRDRRTTLRRLVVPVCVYLVVFGIYFLWRYDRYGYPLPNTFYAKTGHWLGQLRRGAIQDAAFAGQFLVPLLPIVALSLWERSRPSIDRRASWIGGTVRPLRRHPVALLACLVIASYATSVTLVGGDYMAMHRFFVPLLPLLSLGVGHALSPLTAAAPERPARRWVLAGVVAFALGGTLIHSTPLEEVFFRPTPYAHGNYRGIQIERWHVERLKLIGRWVEKHRGEDDGAIGTNAIGAIAFFTRVPVYGVHGLVDAEIAHDDARPGDGGLPGHDRNALDVVLRHEPRFLLLDRNFTTEPSEGGLLQEVPAVLRADVLASYEHKSVQMTDAFNHERGWFNYWERRR